MLSFVLLAFLAGVTGPAPPQPMVDKARATRPPADDTLWYDLREVEIEGKGWNDTENFYDRLPLRAKGVVRDPVWTIGQRSAGLCARFMTDATAIQVRWTLRMERLGMENMSASGVSGLDLYIRNDRGGWGWVGQASPTQMRTNTRDLVAGLAPGWHEFLLYLPLYNGVESVEIGISSAAALSKAPPRPEERRKPIVVYGTSITEGGDASRPGMAYTAILGRRLDRPVINLGFSGNGPMELELARLLRELDPAVFVLDCLPNMDAAQVKERAVPFVKILREARPQTPIVLVENITYQGSPYVAERRERAASKNAALEAAYRDLSASGVDKLFYIPGASLLGDDNDATVDGTHPNDLGFERMADAMEPVLRRALKQ
jgi:lysophospholipase L1-like esterase